MSRETDKVMAALATRRSLRSSSSFANGSTTVKKEKQGDTGIPEEVNTAEDGATSTPRSTSSRKRKRGEPNPATTPSKSSRPLPSPSKMTIKTEEQTTTTLSPSTLPRKPARKPAKKTTTSSGDVEVAPPENWEQIWDVTAAMRKARLAPVDTMGCESLAEDLRPPRTKRFQTLIALMLSSQTKDTVTAVAMKRLQTEIPPNVGGGGLTLESVLAIEPDVLNELIGKVGFHNTKTVNIKKTALVLRDQFDGDIPDSIDGLVSLPGVGPKMAYLTMSAAWGRDLGIGVDVHVHRITNLWGWHKTRTPEETRAVLESWLPRDRWHDINHLLVGFGQTYCLPVGRKCWECGLAEKGLCLGAINRSEIVKKKTLVKQENGEVLEEVKTEVKEEPSVLENGGGGAGLQDIEDIGGLNSSRRSTRLKAQPAT